ncbi:cell envelope integrity protein CreD [Fusobacterium massiliense]|uniref:cell envelope integrity protein CreD n=1 Tax=Fusobacterium massiliense TaxID=1852365 RepID=UPI0028D08263|nr:cell envelope integrity protein CreD [Fusobacterium massiliense]
MENNLQKEFYTKKTSPIMKKIISLFIFSLLLQIPLWFIGSLISDRGDLYNKTVISIGNEWGKNQKIIAPVITISYTDTGIDNKKDIINSKTLAVVPVEKKFVILPDELNAIIKIKDEIRQRGIYNATVYNANMKLKGFFSPKDFPKNKEIKSYLSIGLSDTKALIKINKLKIGNLEKDLDAMSGTMAVPLITNGISAELKLDFNKILEEEKIPFEIDIDFRGSKDISILPLGKKNNIEISSNWKSPSFSGILPSERNINNNGFLAKWEVSNLVRNYPQIIDINEDKYDDFYDENNSNNENTVIKTGLFDSITDYTQITRASKYGILFIMMSLVIVYIFEVISRRFTHYVQYLIVGLSLIIFYLLLLSLSEHIGFEWAYLISSLAIVIPNSLYIMSLTSNKKLGIGMFFFLSGIYAILFSILRMEQYALLTGSLLILTVLYVVMYLTKNTEIFERLENREK